MELLGLVTGGTLKVSACYNNGLIKMNGSGKECYDGGIVGYVYNEGNIIIENCYNTGAIEQQENQCGGICGRVYIKNENSNVSGDIFDVKINNCYDIGNAGSMIINKVFGNAKVSVNNIYYLNNDTSWIGEGVEKITGTDIASTTEEMNAKEFVDKLNGEQENVWEQDIDGSKNNYYPILIGINY